jgi:hypothetical protein
MHYTKTIWNTWAEMQHFLRYKMKGTTLLDHWAIGDALKLTPSAKNLSEQQLAKLLITLADNRSLKQYSYGTPQQKHG